MANSLTLEDLPSGSEASSSNFSKFIEVPRALYSHDPVWVPPFGLELKDRLSTSHNPYFQHAELKAWIAYRNGQPVGRISAQIDAQALKHHHPSTGHFGFFDVADDQEAAAALLGAAEKWLKSKGMTKVLGPYNPTLNEEPGVLIDGFDSPPMMLMGHSQRYITPLLEANGYSKAKDLFAFFLDIRKDVIPDVIKRLMNRFQSERRVVLRRIDMKQYKRDLDIILSIFNDAWSENWGYLPMTDAELKHTADGLKLLIREELTYIAEDQNGRPIGMMVTLPNLNEIIKKIDGKLLPFGWVKLLSWLKLQAPNTLRVPLMGVLKEIQNSSLGAAASFSLIEQIRQNAIARGTAFAELSWILEDNHRMCGILEKIGSIPYKTYRVYTKDLG